MSCNYSVKAFRTSAGEITFVERRGLDTVQTLSLPCGQCQGCRLEHARQWAVRCMHEAQLYEDNCFITLTYNDENIPANGHLMYSDFQNFMKRFRKQVCHYLKTSRHLGPYRKIRFFMCGEYGEQNDRPHYHACVFNYNFPDLEFLKNTADNSKLYTSKTLDSLWSDRFGNALGFATVGQVNFESAGYVARYSLKKVNGRQSALNYQQIDIETGEVTYRPQEFLHMSLKPGIGSGFYDKFKADMYPHDHCIVRGHKTKPPKYYAKKLKIENPELYDELQFMRAREALKHADDLTDERLIVREKCTIAKIRKLPRQTF